MSDPSGPLPNLAETPILIVTRRPSGIPWLAVPPALLVLGAIGLLVVRAGASDWKGLPSLKEWLGGREPVALAPPEKPGKVEAKKDAAPKTLAAVAARPAAPKADEKGAAWNDIQQEAAQKKAELAELEKMKAREDEKAKLHPPQPHVCTDPRACALNNEAAHRLAREQIEATQRQFQQIVRQQQDFQRQMMQDYQRQAAAQRNAFFQRMPGVPPMPPMPGLPPMMPGMDQAGPPAEQVVRQTPNGRFEMRRFSMPNGNGVVIMEESFSTTNGGH